MMRIISDSDQVSLTGTISATGTLLRPRKVPKRIMIGRRPANLRIRTLTNKFNARRGFSLTVTRPNFSGFFKRSHPLPVTPRFTTTSKVTNRLITMRFPRLLTRGIRHVNMLNGNSHAFPIRRLLPRNNSRIDRLNIFSDILGLPR